MPRLGRDVSRFAPVILFGVFLLMISRSGTEWASNPVVRSDLVVSHFLYLPLDHPHSLSTDRRSNFSAGILSAATAIKLVETDFWRSWTSTSNGTCTRLATENAGEFRSYRVSWRRGKSSF